MFQSNTTITLNRSEPYLHIPPPPSSDIPEPYKSQSTLQKPSSSQKWSRGADSLASCWSFTLSLHSLIYLPEAILRHGGVVFLAMYLFLLVILGLPLLLLEIFLGQYSTLPVGRLYRHLCPLLSGLGVSVSLICGVRCVLDLGVATWSSHGMVTMFMDQRVTIHHTSNYSVTALDNISDIVPYNVAALAAVTVTTFILLSAGAKSIGKVSLLLIPLCYGLLITLVIRSMMDPSGPSGFLSLMTPRWSVLSQVTAWLEAAGHVVFSLQLGLGVLITYGGFNKFGHSMIRDSWIIVIGHMVWVMLSVLLVFSLRGVADNNNIIKLPVQADTGETGGVMSLADMSILADSVGLSTIVLILETFSLLPYGWLWSALFSILVILICITDMFGYVETISNSISYHRPVLTRFKPLVSLLTLLSAGLVAVSFTTQGGAHVFMLLQSYIADWPMLLVTVLTCSSAVVSLSMSSVVKFMSIMTRRKLSNYTKSHLTVILVTVVPIIFTVTSCFSDKLTKLYLLFLRQASLGWSLYVLSIKSIKADGGMLPRDWGLPVAWSLSSLAVLPLIIGALWYLTVAARGQIFMKVCVT